MSSNKSIIISLIILLGISFLYLACTETSQQSSQPQNWWVVYFENPKDNSLDFVIENNSNEKNFHWEILEENNKLAEGKIEIAKGEKKSIPVNNFKKNKITIKVLAGQETREIYKIFEK